MLKAFTDFENSPVAFPAPKLVYEYLKHNHPQIGITFRKIQEFEREFVRINKLLKNTKEGKEKGVAIVAYRLDDLRQADLVDTHEKHFVLARIDVTIRQSLHKSQVAHQAGAYAGFRGMKQPGIFLLPPGWDASPSQGYPQH